METLEGFLGFPKEWEITGSDFSGEQRVIQVTSLQVEGRCPSCGGMSSDIHSHYSRSPQDLPCGGLSVRVLMRVCRFRCVNPSCYRATFVSSQGEFLPRYSHATTRLSHVLTIMGFELGGRAGSRLAQHLSIQTSWMSLLRRIRRTVIPTAPPVIKVGIDDWAYRKGTRYGTIMVDLERRQVIDLLPDRETLTVVAWLKNHPEIDLISRDRGGNYAEAGRVAAPLTLQVADRWHLFRNLWEAAVGDCHRYTSLLKSVYALIPVEETPIQMPLRATPHRKQAILTPKMQLRADRRLHWEHQFEAVHRLLAEGNSKNAISKTLGLALRTVKKYARLETLPLKTCPKSHPRMIDPYWNYLWSTLSTRSITTQTLWEELKAQGFRGSRSTVFQAIVKMRQVLKLPVAMRPPKTMPPHRLAVTPLSLVTWSLSPDLSPLKQQLLTRVRQLNPELDLLMGLIQDFLLIVRQHKPQHLIPWIEALALTDFHATKAFAKGLLADFDAVSAACSSPWSNGQVEGQINRLKTLKRQMFGRANFDLLRLRVLYFSRLHEICV